MSRGWLRSRAFVDRQYAMILAALVVLALLGGWLTYGAYAAPGTHTEERTVSSWETTGGFDHSATVVEQNPVFARDEVLDNRTVYFRSIAPVLDGTFRTSYAGADRGDLSVQVNVTLVSRSVGDSEENPTEYWRTTRSLGHAEAGSVSPGESVAVPFSVDADAVANRTERIRDELDGGTGTVTTTVRATVQYSGTVDGQRVDRVENYSLPIGITGSIYRVDDPGATTNPHETTRTETVVEEPGLVSSVGGPVLLAGALAAALALVVARRRGALASTEAEREWLEFREDRGDFDEWIVTMRLPDEVEKMPRAEADTLADLVDFAIDTDNAVVEHPDTGTFAVVHDGYRYVYPPPSNPATVDDADAEEDGDSSAISDYDFGKTEDTGADAEATEDVDAESEEIEDADADAEEIEDADADAEEIEDADADAEEIEDADAEADDGNAGDTDATADPEEIEDRDERKATSE